MTTCTHVQCTVRVLLVYTKLYLVPKGLKIHFQSFRHIFFSKSTFNYKENREDVLYNMKSGYIIVPKYTYTTDRIEQWPCVRLYSIENWLGMEQGCEAWTILGSSLAPPLLQPGSDWWRQEPVYCAASENITHRNSIQSGPQSGDSQREDREWHG